jgi:hypothetical protein
MAARVNLQQAKRCVADREEFSSSTGSMRGVEGVPGDLGRLPYEDRQAFNAQRDEIVYTVMSYATPIAWELEDGTVIIPDTSYSVTTSRHQGIVRAWM